MEPKKLYIEAEDLFLLMENTKFLLKGVESASPESYAHPLVPKIRVAIMRAEDILREAGFPLLKEEDDTTS